MENAQQHFPCCFPMWNKSWTKQKTNEWKKKGEEKNECSRKITPFQVVYDSDGSTSFSPRFLNNPHWIALILSVCKLKSPPVSSRWQKSSEISREQISLPVGVMAI
jgi:hypothetical protein